MIVLSGRSVLFGVDAEIFLEWSLAQQTHSPDAAARLHRHLEAYESGENYQLTYYLGLAAEAYAITGLHAEALALVDRSLTLVDRSGETFWRAELHRLRGASLLALGANDGAADLQQALVIARDQGAGLLAMRSAGDLARLWQAHGRLEAARQLVAQVYGEFSADAALPERLDSEHEPGAPGEA